MLLVFVHGWSVTHTNAYGELPEVLAREAGLEIAHLQLGRYISFHDEVGLDDLARAFDHALRKDIPNNANGRRTFSCITHSTGGPVVRTWVDQVFGTRRLDALPLRHLVMLAPANHGSALAQLGKNRLGRIKAWFGGVEPGSGVLDWLELGSTPQRELNQRWLSARPAAAGFYPVVLTGETIDRRLYDHLNSYTGEPGSDGVIRVASANLNYRSVRLEQSAERLRTRPLTDRLEPVGRMRIAPRVPLGIVPGASHTGNLMGIMRSVRLDQNLRQQPVAAMIKAALDVDSPKAYAGLQSRLERIAEEASGSDPVRPGPRYSMISWRVTDDTGAKVKDFDLLLLAGRHYSPDVLPNGFFQDRQRNRLEPHTLTYYLRADLMRKVPDGLLGFRVEARPRDGFAGYRPAEFRMETLPLDRLIRPDETLLVDIVLKRRCDTETFRIESATRPRRSFKATQPSGADLS